MQVGRQSMIFQLSWGSLTSPNSLKIRNSNNQYGRTYKLLKHERWYWGWLELIPDFYKLIGQNLVSIFQAVSPTGTNFNWTHSSILAWQHSSVALAPHGWCYQPRTKDWKHFNPPVTISLSDRPGHFFFSQVFDLVRPWPYHTLTDLVFFILFFKHIFDPKRQWPYHGLTDRV